MLSSSDENHKKVLFMVSTTSHAARTELETQNILYNTEKLLTKVEKRERQTRLHSQLTKH
jgi:hypothetical protein